MQKHKTKSPAFQFDAAEWLADENISLMTLEEEGAYIRLLACCWREGSISAIPEAVARLTKHCSTTITERVLKQFIPMPGNCSRMIHERLEKERKKQAAWSKKSSEAGKAGAKARWGKEKRTEPNPLSGDRTGWDLKFEDLKNSTRLIAWLEHTKLVPCTRDNEILVLAAAERALSVEKLGGEAPQDRVAYFVSIVRDRNWKVMTDKDRDRGKLRHTQWSRENFPPPDYVKGIIKSPDA